MRTLTNYTLLASFLACLFCFSGPSLAPGQDKKADKSGAIFEIFKDKSKEYRFRLKDEDGAILAISGHGVKTKAEIEKIIAGVKKHAAKAKIEDDSKDK